MGRTSQVPFSRLSRLPEQTLGRCSYSLKDMSHFCPLGEYNAPHPHCQVPLLKPSMLMDAAVQEDDFLVMNI